MLDRVLGRPLARPPDHFYFQLRSAEVDPRRNSYEAFGAVFSAHVRPGRYL